MKTKILYLSYNGMNEALGASQVLGYMYPLSAAYDYCLISLEKSKDWHDQDKMNGLRTQLQSYDIRWFPIEYREDRLGKILNWFRFSLHAFQIIRKNKIQFLHCRSYFPALSAYCIQKIKPIQYLFDTRGFAFDERADTGSVKRNGLLHKIFKRLEQNLYIQAAGVNKLSHEGRRTILENELFEGGDQIKNITVIPTCVDLERFQWLHRTYGETIRIGYVGTAIGWYDFDKTMSALQTIGQQVDYHFTIFNGGQHEYIQSKLDEYGIPAEKVTLEKVDFKDMPNKLKEFEVALFYIHPYFSKRASAATKLGELWASGIPVLTNGHVGDHEQLITESGAGQILDFEKLDSYDFKKIFQNLRTAETSKKSRDVAEQYFSLEKGVEAYKELYKVIFKS